MTTTTTRPVTFRTVDADRVVRTIRTLPAGTEVYASRFRGNTALIRVRGSLLEQTVTLDSIAAA